MIELKGKYTTAKIMIDSIEPKCLSQIHTFLNHPAFTNPIAIMPDCHAGMGSVIGFTMPLTDKVIPNVVGVDIGCGILALKVGKELPCSLEQLDMKIRNKVPFGFSTHTSESRKFDFKNNFPWKALKSRLRSFAMKYNSKGSRALPTISFSWFEEHYKSRGCDFGRVLNSIGTLGGGNHFIEVGLDLNGDFWVVIHTGSRNFGKQICDYWQRKAIRNEGRERKEKLNVEIENIREQHKNNREAIPDLIKQTKNQFPSCSDDLCYLTEENAFCYLLDMVIAQMYAEVNRAEIARSVLGIFGVKNVETKIETTHNYVDFDDFIIRKGSISSYVGQSMIIPFNMRDGLLICEGKSNPEWNYSAPHGAGRVLSRSQAKKKLCIETFEKSMEGIFSTSVCYGTLDESPMAYKDSTVIEQAIEPTATIINKVKPVLNMKDKGK